MEHESIVRFTLFAVSLCVLLLLEVLRPRRSRVGEWKKRKLKNLGIGVINVLVLRWLVPISAVATALYAEASNSGLLQQFDGQIWPIIAGVVFLDCAIYWQHRVFHRIPLLWKIHRLHHSDLEFDVTTAVRFHPIEIVVSMVIKCALVLVLGVPVIAVLIFEVLLSSCALFNHSNINLGASTDSVLRRLVVTPDMHRVHHSIDDEEMNRNFGFCLSCWDHLFNSYQAEPKFGDHKTMQIGMRRFRDHSDQRLVRLMLQPFR